jgi:hypothetical protein
MSGRPRIDVRRSERGRRGKAGRIRASLAIAGIVVPQKIGIPELISATAAEQWSCAKLRRPAEQRL